MADDTSQEGGLSGVYFNAPDAEINAGRDIGCGNIVGNNNTSIVNHYYGKSSSSDNEVNKIISWLATYSVDYYPAHEKACSQRASDTGKWFSKTTIYKLWITIGRGKYRNLECVGIPGAGKTTMASMVIEDLQCGIFAKRGMNVVLFAYFRHDTQSTQTIPIVLASLLLQVIKRTRKVSSGIRKLYEDYSSYKKIPSEAAYRIATLLRQELSKFLRTYIIVDALDEYLVPDYSSSHALVEELQRLDARLLITSRYAVGFSSNTFSTLHVSAHADDIRIFVRKHLTGHLATLVANTPGLFDEIVNAIIIKSAGMFVVARLLVSCIPNSQSMTSNELRAVMKDLPTGIENIYKMAITRVQDQEPHLAELGMAALSWVYFSGRRLTVLELRHAVSCQRYGVISNDDLIGESACAGLIVFVKAKDRQKTMRCQFSHFTAKEFLDKSWRNYFPNGERQITETCLSYLGVAVSNTPPEVMEAAQVDDDGYTVWRQYCQGRGLALCAYAAEYWLHHVTAIEEAFDLDAGADFFTSPVSPITDKGSDTILFCNDGSTLAERYWILYFARFGLIKHLQKYMPATGFGSTAGIQSSYYDIRDEALHISALRGHPKVVEFLLDSGANVNLPFEGSGMRPLHRAVQASASGVTMVQLLLDRGARVDQPDCESRAPIFYATQPDRSADTQPSLDIIQLLLHREVNIYRCDNSTFGTTPLLRAQESDNAEIRQLFVDYARTHPLKPKHYKQRFPDGRVHLGYGSSTSLAGL